MSKILVANIDDLEKQTRGQASSERWREERAIRLSSSYFKQVASRRDAAPFSKLVKQILYGHRFQTKAMRYGLANEDIARNQYENMNSVLVAKCGLFVEPGQPFLCTSPDGLVGTDGLIEIKCPYSARESKSLLQFYECNKNFGIKLNEKREVFLPRSHTFFYQIQGQLHITNRKWCNLFLWCCEDSLTIRIERDQKFWTNIMPKLEFFYYNCLLPEILDPRVPRNMPIREPHPLPINTEKKRKLALKKEDKILNTATPVKKKRERLSNKIHKATNIQTKERTYFSKRLRKPKVIFDL